MVRVRVNGGRNVKLDLAERIGMDLLSRDFAFSASAWVLGGALTIWLVGQKMGMKKVGKLEMLSRRQRGSEA